jgi:hypothetical protein
MPQIRANKIQTPINGDSFPNFVNDLAALADSANVVIPVASQAERDALTKKNGLLVCRTDLPGCPIERCDGTTWWGDSSQTLTLNTTNFSNPPGGYGPLTLQVSGGGRIITVTGNVTWTNGSNGNNVATIPSGYYPVTEVAFSSTSQANSTGNIGTSYRGQVTTAGALNLNWMGGGIARSTDFVIPILATWRIA